MNIIDISILDREQLNLIQMNIQIKDPQSIQCTYMSIDCAKKLVKNLSYVLNNIKDKESFKELLPELEFSKSVNFCERDTSDYDEVEIAKINYYNKLLMRGTKK